MNCNVCGKDRETRLGACWHCAEAESILSEGLDMYDKGPNGDDSPASSPMEKLKYLISKGWCYSAKNKNK